MSEETSTGAPRRIVRDGYPEGVTCWVDCEVPDPAAAAEFYGGLFGWELEDRMPPDAPGHYYSARIDGLDVAAVGSQPEGSSVTARNTYVWVESADETAAKVTDAGGSILREPFDVMQAGRMAVVADPQGAALRLWQAGEHRGAQLVNEYGAWNFSGLTTTDVDGAIEFYRAALGWEAERSDEWTFFRVPGYGDHLAQRDPTLRERLSADDDAPKGFEDATAWVTGMEGQPEGAPPNWGVTFSVEDADAIAARASELGGKVLAEPFDAPPVRMAVLSDPQGAVFTVTRYYPAGAERT